MMTPAPHRGQENGLAASRPTFPAANARSAVAASPAGNIVCSKAYPDVPLLVTLYGYDFVRSSAVSLLIILRR